MSDILSLQWKHIENLKWKKTDASQGSKGRAEWNVGMSVVKFINGNYLPSLLRMKRRVRVSVYHWKHLPAL